MIVLAAFLVIYFALTEALDWVGRMDVIEKRMPRLAKVLGSRALRLLLLLVAVGLLVRVYTEPRQEAARPSPRTSGPATTHGDNSPANTGDGNTFNYKEPPKPTSPTKKGK
jgi:hypothetical protein